MILNKNKYLESVLEEIGKNTDEVWSSIITSGGSVQHLAFLDKRTKPLALATSMNAVSDEVK